MEPTEEEEENGEKTRNTLSVVLSPTAWNIRNSYMNYVPIEMHDRTIAFHTQGNSNYELKF